MIGQTLSHFRITAKLGEGGMGEVYRAEDTKLDRQVAIKVLPEVVAQDPERLARFEREAKVLASLNHSNIAAIYQVEQDEDTHFLVMELVEGEDLRERLARGPVDIDEALSLASQVAEALEAAHDSGVIHRDLKPANVRVTPEGQVKVLDFGLAKAFDVTAGPDSGSAPSAAAAGVLSMSPTLTAQMTQAGVILGTAAYMSPEQARGKPVDKRADVWAFGVMLWEILTARPLFAGETVTDVIASVVTTDPDTDNLPESTPPEVQRLLARCLRKDPQRRLPHIGAARLVLQDLLMDTTPTTRSPVTGPQALEDGGRSGRGRSNWLWAIGFLAIALGVGTTLGLRAPQAGPAPTVRFASDAPDGWDFTLQNDWPVPSPAGDRVVFRATRNGGTESGLWLRSLESLTPIHLGGTEGVGGYGPIVWSPDGRNLLFRVGRELRTLDLTSGTASVVGQPAREVDGATWNDSGTILVAEGGQRSLIYSYSTTRGDAGPLTSLLATRDEVAHYYPQFLPDGRRFLFHIHSGRPETTGLHLASLDDPDSRQRIVEHGETWLRWHYAAGHLFFVAEGTLFAQPFDPKTARLSGSPLVMAPSVASLSELPGVGLFGVSSGGTLSYFPGSLSSEVQLAWVDRAGNLVERVGEPGEYGQIALSPDGRNVALEILNGGQYDLWVMDIARGVTSRVTATPDNERDPVWSPDGRSLAYIQRQAGGASLRRKGLRASDPETVLMEAANEFIPESWSADGRTMLVVQRTPADMQSIWALVEGEEPQPFVTPGFRVDEPQISPDGQWIAYVSPESDQEEVYLEPFRRDGERVRISLKGGGQPKWRGDSKELYFAQRDGLLMAVEVSAEEGRTEVSLPKELFKLERVEGAGLDDYAVSTDGERFLIKTLSETVELRLQIITNWQGLLE